jgi:hypothetical protein
MEPMADIDQAEPMAALAAHARTIKGSVYVHQNLLQKYNSPKKDSWI